SALQNESIQSGLQSSRDLSLAELEEIGNESGIGPQFIQAAAKELYSKPFERYSDQNSTHIFEERDLEFDVTADAWDELTAELRNYFGTGYGKIKEDPKRLEWSHFSIGGIETKVNLTIGDHSGRLRFSQRVGMAGSVTEGILFGFVIAFLGTIFTIPLLEYGAWVSASIFTTLLLLGTPVTYALDRAWRRKKQQDLKKLSDKIARRLFQSRKRNLKKKLKLETDLAEKIDRQNLQNIMIENEDSEETSEFENRSRQRNR
ncbi:MAG: hypothetical protein GVY02_07815, partial [Bacteroidetes bacterium]|nr:hypothetical protein [Bacteroidota bacterium]